MHSRDSSLGHESPISCVIGLLVRALIVGSIQRDRLVWLVALFVAAAAATVAATVAVAVVAA